MPGGTALFGSAATGPGSTGGNKHLVEMRAGKMNLKGRMVYPDKRKGLLYVYQSEDSLMHFCWQDRTTGIVEDDLIIFPDDCEYVKVPQCTTGRAYLLKFKSSSRKYFFWVQEPRVDKDDDNCKRINELLNNPSMAVQSSPNPEHDFHSLLSSMSQAQLMQFFGGMGNVGGLSSLLGTIRGPNSGSARTGTTPALTHRAAVPSTPTTTATATAAAASTTQSSAAAPATATATAAPVPGQTTPLSAPIPVTTPGAPRAQRARDTAAPEDATNPIQLRDLRSFLQGISSIQSAPQQGQQQAGVDLSTALNNDSLTGILNNREALQQLQSHLPPIDATTEEVLRSTLASPQFQQAVSQFSSALESGQLGPVVSQLAVNSEAVAAATSGNMQEFIKALEKSTNSSSSEGADVPKKEDQDKKEPKKDKDEDDDEQMQLD